MTVYNNELYIAVSRWEGFEVNFAYAHIWKYNGSNWTQIIFEPTDMYSSRITGMEVLNNSLYVSIRGNNESFSPAETVLWEYDNGNWIEIGKNNFRENEGITNMSATEKNGDPILLIATNLQIGITNYPELWRYNKNTDTFNKIFDETSYGSQIISIATTNNNKAYFSTVNYWNGGTHIFELNYDTWNWTQINIEGFGSSENTHSYLEFHKNELYAIVTNYTDGAKVFKYSGTGTNWSQVNTDGFGVGITEINNITSDNNFLYVGSTTWDSPNNVQIFSDWYELPPAEDIETIVITQTSPKNQIGTFYPTFRWTDILGEEYYTIEVKRASDNWTDPLYLLIDNIPADTSSIISPIRFEPDLYTWRIYATADGETNLLVNEGGLSFEVVNIVPEFKTYLYLLTFLIGGFAIYQTRKKSFEF